MEKPFSKAWSDAGGISHSPLGAQRRRRIISLVPSLTETLCAVGGRNRLMGCTAFCTRPADLLKDRSIAKVGGTKTINRDRILKLYPDLLLLNLEENTLEDIDFFRNRVECYINGVKNLLSGIATIRELASLIGNLDGGEMIAVEAEKSAATIQSAVKKRKTRPRIFYAIWHDPWMTVNSDTFIHDQLQTCGAVNVFGNLAARYPVISEAQIEAAAPDVVWLPSEPFRFKSKHVREFSERFAVPAAQTGRVELVDGDNVCWFGARQIEGTAYTFERIWKRE